MRPFVFHFTLFVLFGFGTTQYIDVSIKVVVQNKIGGNIHTSVIKPNSGSQPENNSCTCVPYYLCNENDDIITDGAGVITSRLQSNEGCGHYLEVCCKIPIVRITPKPPVNKSTGCGRRNNEGVGFRITGNEGLEAEYAEFPWMVAILSEERRGNPNKDSTYQCGGALIHPQVVLTAAHCLIGKDKAYKIRAGDWDTQTTNEILPHQDRIVKQVVTHKDYYAGAQFNNVALMFLQEPVEITGNVDVICLPPQDMIFNRSRCVASGWGKDRFGKNPEILKKIELPIVNSNDCQEKLRKTKLGTHFQLNKNFICAGGEVGKSTCLGDDGSPLVCPLSDQPERYVQAGIVAWGSDCGENQVPSVFVNIPHFRNWIDDQMRSQGYGITTYSY